MHSNIEFLFDAYYWINNCHLIMLISYVKCLSSFCILERTAHLNQRGSIFKEMVISKIEINKTVAMDIHVTLYR